MSCNNNCSQCYQKHEAFPGLICKGEPTIRKDFFSMLSPDTILVSNGRMFYYPEFVRRYAAVSTRTFIKIMGASRMTHDSITRVAGSFDQTDEGMRNLSAQGLRFGCIIRVLEQNVAELEAMVRYAISRNAEEIVLDLNCLVPPEETLTGLSHLGARITSNIAPCYTSLRGSRILKRPASPVEACSRCVSSYSCGGVQADMGPTVPRKTSARILLIDPINIMPYGAFRDIETGDILPSIALARLNACLEKRSVPHDNLDMTIIARQAGLSIDPDDAVRYMEGEDIHQAEETLRKIIGGLDIKRYSLIGISVKNPTLLVPAIMTARYMRKITDVPIVMGGTVHEMLHKDPNIDMFVYGEGEETLVRLVDSIDGHEERSTVPNLVYKEGEPMLSKAWRNTFTPIRNEALPIYDDDTIKRYAKHQEGAILPYQFIKGCTHSCNFCSYTGKLSVRDPEQVVRDLSYYRSRYGTNRFYFYNPHICIGKPYLHKLMDLLGKHGPFLWSDSARCDMLDKEIIRKMASVGCKGLCMGLESGSQRMIDKMGKGFDIGSAEKIIREIHDAGIFTVLNFVVGYPGEEEEDFQKTIDFLDRNRAYVDSIDLNIFVLYSHARIFKIQEAQGIRVREEIKSRITEYLCGFNSYSYDIIGGPSREEWKKVGEKRFRMMSTRYKDILRCYQLSRMFG